MPDTPAQSAQSAQSAAQRRADEAEARYRRMIARRDCFFCSIEITADEARLYRGLCRSCATDHYA